ncbi:MAG: 30S ribosomal protein S21 [Mycoplasmataceae bacterium]|jgi:small subunit ribosomal protein S21|nr:30S ribosomal protein S21 [Mycoplasmataceae bacterium]
MAKVVIKNDDVQTAFKKFSRITAENKKDAKKHEFYLRPGLKAVAKREEAAKTKVKFNAKKKLTKTF